MFVGASFLYASKLIVWFSEEEAMNSINVFRNAEAKAEKEINQS